MWTYVIECISSWLTSSWTNWDNSMLCEIGWGSQLDWSSIVRRFTGSNSHCRAGTVKVQNNLWLWLFWWHTAVFSKLLSIFTVTQSIKKYNFCGNTHTLMHTSLKTECHKTIFTIITWDKFCKLILYCFAFKNIHCETLIQFHDLLMGLNLQVEKYQHIHGSFKISSNSHLWRIRGEARKDWCS